MIEIVRLAEDDVDAAPTSSIVSLKKKDNEDQNNSDQLSTRSDRVKTSSLAD